MVFEDAEESLIGSKAAEGDRIGECLVVRGVLRVDKNGLGVLDAVLCDELGETEIGASVDTSRDVGTVGTDG